MSRLILLALLILILVGIVIYYISQTSQNISIVKTPQTTTSQSPTPNTSTFPMAIDAMKAKNYPGSDITIEQTLSDGPNYHRYVVSYQSDGLKIYGFLTVPTNKKPTNGWSVILMNHGYIPPAQYSTVDSYSQVVDSFASHDFIVFKPDYRGNGNSSGTPTQAYVSPDYVTDSLNALASIKRYKDANPDKIGIWAHSMGGNITLHEMVIAKGYQAVDIWAGVVGPYSEILDWWHRRIANRSIIGNDLETAHIIQQFEQQHGTPQTNPNFWNSIDPTNFLVDVTVPVYLQVGTADAAVPVQFSEDLYQKLKRLEKNVQIKSYQGADHNLNPDSAQAMQDSINFFNTYLK